MSPEQATFDHLGVASAIGLLIGVERGWSEREEQEGTRIAGVRAFALTGSWGVPRPWWCSRSASVPAWGSSPSAPCLPRPTWSMPRSGATSSASRVPWRGGSPSCSAPSPPPGRVRHPGRRSGGGGGPAAQLQTRAARLARHPDPGRVGGVAPAPVALGGGPAPAAGLGLRPLAGAQPPPHLMGGGADRVHLLPGLFRGQDRRGTQGLPLHRLIRETLFLHRPDPTLLPPSPHPAGAEPLVCHRHPARVWHHAAAHGRDPGSDRAGLAPIRTPGDRPHDLDPLRGGAAQMAGPGGGPGRDRHPTHQPPGAAGGHRVRCPAGPGLGPGQGDGAMARGRAWWRWRRPRGSRMWTPSPCPSPA